MEKHRYYDLFFLGGHKISYKILKKVVKSVIIYIYIKKGFLGGRCVPRCPYPHHTTTRRTEPNEVSLAEHRAVVVVGAGSPFHHRGKSTACIECRAKARVSGCP